MSKIAIQDLERGKFTKDSNVNESIVRTTVLEKDENEKNDVIRHTELIAVLTSIECKLDKLCFIMEANS